MRRLALSALLAPAVLASIPSGFDPGRMGESQPVFTAEEVAEARSLRSSEIGVQSDGSAISGRALPEEQYTFNLYGLTKPTSITWDPYGHAFIAEKAGVVKMTAPGQVVGEVVNTILDIQGQVSSFGDHGLTTILWDEGYLYATFMALNPKYGNACADYGQPDGRPNEQINGCAITGMFVRYPISAAGVITGPQQVLLDTAVGNKACVQFSTHSAPTTVLKGGDGYFYLAFGDGAGFTMVDAGQLGLNPCGDNPGYMGAYRSQDPARLNGKSIRMNPVDWTYTTFTTGHRNPFRMMLHNGGLYATETGWYSFEELNHLQEGKNYGWPCYEALIRAPEYINFQVPVCAQMVAEGSNTPPAYSYGHPQVVASMVTSISAAASYGGRVFVGDYTAQWIKSLDGANFGDEQLIARDVACVDLRVSPQNVLVSVDIEKGFIRNVPMGAGAVLASASPAPAAPTATIIPRTLTWTPGVGKVTVSSTNNVEAREGATYQWTVVLLSGCSADGNTCGWTWAFTAMGGATFTFDAPNAAGVQAMEVSLTVRTMAGLQATAQVNIPVAGAQPCPCKGVRTPVALQPIPAGQLPPPGQGGDAVGTPLLAIESNQAAWTPGIGVLSWNLQASAELGATPLYQCSVIALTACSADATTCSWTYLFGPQDLGTHPVFSFNSPLIMGGGTLEVACTATGNGLVETNKAQLPSVGQAVCTCAGVRTEAAVGVLPDPFAGPNPQPGAVINPEQAAWQPGQGRLAFVAHSGLQNLPGTAYNWGVTLLFDCSDNYDDCKWAHLFSVVAGQRLEFAAPNIPAGGTLEVTVDIRATDGTERVEHAVVQLPSYRQQQCVCGGIRTQAPPVVAPSPNATGPINPLVGGPATITPLQSSWNPRGTGRLTFVVSSPLDRMAGVRYTWTVLLLTRCTVDGGDCGWTLLFQTEPASQRAVSFDPPAVLLGGTLEVTCVASTPGRNMSTGVSRIPSTGATVCPCGGNRVQVALQPSNAGGPQTETYMYAGTVVTTQPPNPVSSGSDAKWWERIDTSSTGFIAGVAAAGTVLGAAVVVAAGYLLSRGAPDRVGGLFAARGGRTGAGTTAAGGAGGRSRTADVTQSVTSTTSITAVVGSPTGSAGGPTTATNGRKLKTGMSPRGAREQSKERNTTGGSSNARDTSKERDNLAARRAGHPPVAPVHTGGTAPSALISPAVTGAGAGTPQGPRRV